jgi:hypothetical protein
MAALTPKTRTAILVLLGCVASHAQSGPDATPPSPPVAPSHTTEPANDKPIPDVVAMMRDVETNQRKAESIQKDYIYHSVETEKEFDGHGQVKKITVTESDHFWVNGVPVRRVVKKDGKDLSTDEIAKENERIDKLTAKSSERREKADENGKETDPRGNEEVTVSRLLELGSFTGARRVVLNGRNTIAVDFAGNPKAKTHNRTEEVIRDMVGTAWIDEEDHVLARADGHFLDAFKVGGGLLMSVQKNTRFSMLQTKVNGEVWLPERLEGQGAIHALLFFGLNGSGEIVNSDYRKFRATSKILPGVTRANAPLAKHDTAQP